MLHSTSLRLRLVVSVGANILRALLGFAAGLLIARGLNPAGYGDLMFLLGSFVAIRSLLDMGSSSAFYTFLSRRPRGLGFYGLYFAWMAIQFCLTLMLVMLVIPEELFQKIWLGTDRSLVMLAFMAAFLQQQLWPMMGQIGESMRKTVKVQLMNLAVALVYLVAVLVLLSNAWMTIERVLWLLVAQYAIAVLISRWVLWDRSSGVPQEEESIPQMLGEYWNYCKPLAALALISFAYDFADKWMLQRFGGAAEQGYFQIASQFAAVSLLATTSVLTVFWKEIAEAWAAQDHSRMERLYKRSSRSLVMLGAVLTGALIPWAEHIVRIALGESYAVAWPVLAIMLLYPIHQSLGQIGGTMLLATGHTRKYMMVSMGMMMLSIPVSYLVLAPSNSPGLSGWEMGAEGMAWKMVVLGMVSANLQAWVVARHSGWRFDWGYQVVGLPVMISLGFAVKWMVELAWGPTYSNPAELIGSVLMTGIIYSGLVAVTLIQMPWLAGFERQEVRNMLERVKRRLSWN